jgi:hypothetical protein
MVEKKCVEIVQKHAQTRNELSNEQWQALIALHRTLLHEYHDFFLASQHPVAPKALQTLPVRHDLPGRLWRVGNRTILDLLKRALPDHLKSMMQYVLLSRNMLERLNDEFPEFDCRWAECMRDLETYHHFLEAFQGHDRHPRYSAALGIDSEAERRTWSNVARMWYQRANDIGEARGLDSRPDVAANALLQNDSYDASYDGQCHAGSSSNPQMQADFDLWAGELNPVLFEIHPKDRWPLLGWLHFGKRIATSLWSYRKIFSLMLLNILL